MLVVVTMTCARSNNSPTSAAVLGLCLSTQTVGWSAVPARTKARGSLRTPRVRNFSAIWVRSASVGTTTRTREQPADTRTDNIVSVFPVPVGITIVDGSEDTDHLAWIAWIAPI